MFDSIKKFWSPQYYQTRKKIGLIILIIGLGFIIFQTYNNSPQDKEIIIYCNQQWCENNRNWEIELYSGTTLNRKISLNRNLSQYKSINLKINLVPDIYQVKIYCYDLQKKRRVIQESLNFSEKDSAVIRLN